MKGPLLRLVPYAALAVIGLGCAARAAEIAIVQAPDGAREIALSGIIAPGDAAKLSAAMALAPGARSLALSSLGGNVEAALAIGTLVRRQGLRTTVPPRGLCASACGLVWLAGTPRAMGLDAHVGLHAAYLRRNGIDIETGAANALIGAYLSRLGLADPAIVYLTSAAPDEMTWILAADRQRYGIAFDTTSAAIARSTAAPAPETHFLARPLAMAGAIASAAVAVVDRLLGRTAAPAAVPLR